MTLVRTYRIRFYSGEDALALNTPYDASLSNNRLTLATLETSPRGYVMPKEESVSGRISSSDGQAAHLRMPHWDNASRIMNYRVKLAGKGVYRAMYDAMTRQANPLNWEDARILSATDDPSRDYQAFKYVLAVSLADVPDLTRIYTSWTHLHRYWGCRTRLERHETISANPRRRPP